MRPAWRRYAGWSLAPALVSAALLGAGASSGAPSADVPAPALTRPAGPVFDWSHELNEEELPNWNPKHLPYPPKQWFRIIDGILQTAGRNGLWFSGFGALPFDVPLNPKEPKQWRNPANFMRQYRRTGLSWDVNLEARAAKIALGRKTAVISNPAVDAPTRRLSLLDPGYRRAALGEIHRLVPFYRRLPYVYAFTGSDEPIVVLPRGKALRSRFGRRLAAGVLREYGQKLPAPAGHPRNVVQQQLRWLAFSRYASEHFFDLKAQQARLIRRLDPKARIIPNDYGFIDGFMPWDYTRLGGFADLVEADPFVSYDEGRRDGRGRYNPGFGAKLLSDLTGKPVRIIIQAFPYAGYKPRPSDLHAWASQALRAGATDISFYTLGDPRFTNKPLYAAILDIARRMRGARLPAFPSDPGTVVVYATASEGQGQPQRAGDARYRTSGDALYTTYSLLGELAHGDFVFDSDTRLTRDPSRLAAAHTVWLPRGDTLDRPFAQKLLAWVQGGGTLIVTDPNAFTRAPDGSSLASIRSALIGAPLGRPRTGDIVFVQPDALDPGLPADLLTLPIDSPVHRAFASVPSGATVVGRFIDDSPAIIERSVGSGRVLAFASDPMAPESLDQPLDLVTFVAAVQQWSGGRLGDPTWNYRLPGTRNPSPWKGAYAP